LLLLPQAATPSAAVASRKPTAAFLIKSIPLLWPFACVARLQGTGSVMRL
jgi:hypothetical protein